MKTHIKALISHIYEYESDLVFKKSKARKSAKINNVLNLYPRSLALAGRQLAQNLKIHLLTVSRFCKKFESEESPEDKPRSGVDPLALDPVSKITLNLLKKKRQYTRKLSKRISNHEHRVSYMTVRRLLFKSLGARAYGRTKIDRTHVKNRLISARTGPITGPKRLE